MERSRLFSVQSLMISGIMVLIVSCTKTQQPSLQASTTYWPTNGWRVANPEEQGMDAVVLNQLLEAIDKNKLNIHGLVVVRNGYIVLEKYFPPYEQDTLHDLFSVTKSVVSALTGIAIQEGYINSVDDPVMDYFPDQTFKNQNEIKESITLEHLLTMSSGLEWDYDQMVSSRDWVQYTLDQPVYTEPGQEFLYNSGNAQILSALIQKVSKMDTRDFGQKYLFNPLGIEEYHWQLDVIGIAKGGWGLSLTPRDMAKLGYLYLKGGEWDGQQIISSDWVTASTKRYVQVQEPLEPWDIYMGYMWWLHEDGLYAAQGMKGQFVYIIPEKDVVVVITANIPDSKYHIPQMLIREYIIPSISSTSATK